MSVKRQRKIMVMLIAILMIAVLCFTVLMACGKKGKSQETDSSLDGASEEQSGGSGEAPGAEGGNSKGSSDSEGASSSEGASDSGEGEDTGGSTSSDGAPTQSSTSVVNMTTSYTIGRFRFMTITGLSLPELEDLEAGEDTYQNGDTFYRLELIGGDALDYETYSVFVNYFNQMVGVCDEGYPIGSEATGETVQWTSGDRRYQADWSVAPLSIRILTTQTDDGGAGSGSSSETTESYRAGKEALSALTGIEIPEIDGITLIETSDIDATDGAVCLRFAGNGEIFSAICEAMRYSVYKRSDCVGQGESAVEESDRADWRMVIEIDDLPTLIHVGISISGSTIEIVGEVDAAG